VVRVALVIERFGPTKGGVERAASNVVAELATREIDLTVVCREADTAVPGGVALDAVGGPRFWQPLRVLAFPRRARAATRGYDVVHSFSRTRHQHIYRAGGGSHAAYMEQMYASPRLQRLSPRHRVILAIEEAVFRDARQIVQCNSQGVADEIAARYDVPRERLFTLYNGVDTLRFNPERRAARGGPIRTALGTEGPVALFVGHGFARKGLQRAIDGLADAGGKAHLLVVGRDDPRPYREQARRRGVEQRVLFLGPRLDIPELHAAADLFILPTHYDAFSNACLEAMASGLPVATTPTNGAAELIEPGVSGWICEQDFSPAFAGIEDGERLQQMGAAARRRAESLTWRAHAERLLELYEGICG
jgi:UDP-glucose:(heptosyl)LPS alpha-1,3-glucosyltransferase